MHVAWIPKAPKYKEPKGEHGHHLSWAADFSAL